MSEANTWAPPSPFALPQRTYPNEIMQPLLEARARWAKHGYQVCRRAMEESGIDEALDDMNEFNAAVNDFEKEFGNE